MRNTTLALIQVLLLVPAAFAGYSFNQPFFTLTDNTLYCATLNCLTSIGGVLAETKAGFDGTIYGLTSAGVLETYTPAKGWVEAPAALQTAGGLSLKHISVGSASQVLALNSAASPTPNVYVLNSAGTAWTELAGWLSPAEIGTNGNIVGIGSDGKRLGLYQRLLGRTVCGRGFKNVSVGSAAANGQGLLWGARRSAWD